MFFFDGRRRKGDAVGIEFYENFFSETEIKEKNDFREK